METPAAIASRLLIIVSADPRQSGRLAEAIRLSAGIGAWQKVAVTLFVGGPAVNGLRPGEGRFVDEDNIVEFLPALAAHQREVYVEAGHPMLTGGGEPLPFPQLDEQGLARLAARHDYVMHF